MEKTQYIDLLHSVCTFFKPDLAFLFIPNSSHSNEYKVFSIGKLLEPIFEQGRVYNFYTYHAPEILIEEEFMFLESPEDYLISSLNVINRKWTNKGSKSDFWHREKIKSMVGGCLVNRISPVAVLFMNYRIKKVFDEEFKNQFKSFCKMAQENILLASTLTENNNYKEQNLLITGPVMESRIISGQMHDILNTVNSLSRTFIEVQRGIDKSVRKDILSSKKGSIKDLTDKLGRTLEALSSDLKNIKALQRRTISSNFEEGNLNELVEEVIGLTQNLLNKNRIRVNIRYLKYVRVQFDRSNLMHAILNLIINAIDEMPKGGILSISIDVGQKNNYASLKIRDSGGGVNEELMGKIFKPYFTTKKTGTGLGLSSVKYIIEQLHHGRIEVKTSIGKGTVFEIILPLSRR